MMASFRPALAFLVLIASFCPAAAAQSGSFLPSEDQLNRYGLTMDWWGQAVLDPRRDRVLFLTADEHNVYVQSTAGVITTFGGETGQRLWTNLLGSPDQTGHPAASNEEQLLVSIGMQVYALNKMTGEVLWRIRPPNHPSAAPGVDERRIFIGTVDGSVYAYNLRRVHELAQEGMLPQWIQRARLWYFKTPREIVSSPLPSGDIVSFASRKGIVYGINTADKKLRFQFESDGDIHAPLGHSKEFLFIADENARMYCIHLESGRMRWAFSAGAPIRQRPIVIGRQVLVIPQREGLVALSVESGRELWPPEPRVTRFLAASATRIYAKDESGNLLILNRENGRILGSLPFRNFSLYVSNDRTDRIFLATESGTVISIREQASDYPVFHLNPERRPILPDFAPEEGEEPEPEADAEADTDTDTEK